MIVVVSIGPLGAVTVVLSHGEPRSRDPGHKPFLPLCFANHPRLPVSSTPRVAYTLCLALDSRIETLTVSS